MLRSGALRSLLSEFQTVGPTTANARRPYVSSCILGTTSRRRLAERRCCCSATWATGVHSSDICSPSCLSCNVKQKEPGELKVAHLARRPRWRCRSSWPRSWWSRQWTACIRNRVAWFSARCVHAAAHEANNTTHFSQIISNLNHTRKRLGFPPELAFRICSQARILLQKNLLSDTIHVFSNAWLRPYLLSVVLVVRRSFPSMLGRCWFSGCICQGVEGSAPFRKGLNPGRTPQIFSGRSL